MEDRIRTIREGQAAYISGQDCPYEGYEASLWMRGYREKENATLGVKKMRNKPPIKWAKEKVFLHPDLT